MRILLAALVFPVMWNPVIAAVPDPGRCLGDDGNKAQWTARINNGFSALGEDETEIMARLQACLAVIDPAVRDGIGYTGIATWLRKNPPATPLLLSLYERLSSDIESLSNDEAGVYLPFAVLAYSEVIRADRITPFLSPQERGRSLNIIGRYLDNLHDYRSFNDVEGWRHGLAHAADVLLQLALNPALTDAQLKQTGNIILAHISPPDAPAFTAGEPARLARAMAYTVLRQEVAVSFWQSQIELALQKPGYADWADAYVNSTGLITLHNYRSFFDNLVSRLVYEENPRLQTLAPWLKVTTAPLR